MLHYFMKECLYYRDGYWQILQIDLGYNFFVMKINIYIYIYWCSKGHTMH